MMVPLSPADAPGLAGGGGPFPARPRAPKGLMRGSLGLANQKAARSRLAKAGRFSAGFGSENTRAALLGPGARAQARSIPGYDLPPLKGLKMLWRHPERESQVVANEINRKKAEQSEFKLASFLKFVVKFWIISFIFVIIWGVIDIDRSVKEDLRITGYERVAPGQKERYVLRMLGEPQIIYELKNQADDGYIQPGDTYGKLKINFPAKVLIYRSMNSLYVGIENGIVKDTHLAMF
jgi:hypothetical protein